MQKTMIAAAACLLLAACSKPLPPDKGSYAGYWRAHDMALLITAGGNVQYTRREGGRRTKVNAPLKKFEGDNFVIGFGPMETTFAVTEPPHNEQGRWHMTVDGVDLIRDQ